MLIEILGWLGTLSLIVAYFLVSSGKIGGQTKIYQFLNLLGAVLVGTNSWFHGALPSVGINVLWIMIGFYGLWQIFRKK
jgi:hypothetical protein